MPFDFLTPTVKAQLRRIYLHAAMKLNLKHGEEGRETFCCPAIEASSCFSGDGDKAISLLWGIYAPGAAPDIYVSIWEDNQSWKPNPDQEARTLALLLLRERLTPERRPRKVFAKRRLQ